MAGGGSFTGTSQPMINLVYPHLSVSAGPRCYYRWGGTDDRTRADAYRSAEKGPLFPVDKRSNDHAARKKIAEEKQVRDFPPRPHIPVIRIVPKYICRAAREIE